MYKCKLKLIFSKSTTINNTQIDHIWTNAPTQQCHSKVTQTYWIDHKLVYFTFKLSYYIPQFILSKTYYISNIYHLCLSNKIHQLPFKLKLNCE